MPGFNIDGDGSGPSNTDETARKHRYLFTVLEPLQDVLLYAYKCQRPIAEVDRIVMHQGQDEIYLPGKNRWHPIEITFYEPVEGSDLTARYLNQWYAKAMIDLPASRLNPVESYKKRAELELHDGAGFPIYTYQLYDVWPSKITPSELSYADTDLAEITVTMEIGKAEELPGSANRVTVKPAC